MKKYTNLFLTVIMILTALTVVKATAPANDNFINAENIVYNGDAVTISSNNIEATRETGEPFHYFGTTGEKSVWYKFTVSGTFAMQVEMSENFNSSFSVYTASVANPAFADLVNVRSSTDASGYNGKYQTRFLTQTGKTYYIALDSAILMPREGNFQLTLKRSKLRYHTDFTPSDYRAEIAVFRPNEGRWYCVYDTRQEFAASNIFFTDWGLATDTLVPSDFNGDSRTENAIVRNEGGQKVWYFAAPFGTPPQYTRWGLETDKATAGDFDRDGRADLVAIRQTAQGLVWYVRQSSDAAMRVFNFGLNTDKSVLGDFDGDGATDVAVTRNVGGDLVWYILKSGFDSNPNATYTEYSSLQFGLGTDLTAIEDFDGDGKTDVGVFRPSNGTWYISRSATNELQVTQFGANSDIPQPADYDGDGKADLGTFRPADGDWYFWYSGNNTQKIIHWGTNGDIPISSINSLPQ